MTKIKYSEELIAFLERKPVQIRFSGFKEWCDLKIPETEIVDIKIDEWQGNTFEYRIKPKMMYYRTALMKNLMTDELFVLSKSSEKAENIKTSLFSTNNMLFVKWLTDIVTVELED